MKYDFNAVRQMLDQGVSVEDLCNEFAAEVNKVTAELEEENKTKRRYQLMLEDITNEWNALIDYTWEEHKLPKECAQALYITPKFVDTIVNVITELMAVNNDFVSLIEKLVNQTNTIKEAKKIVAKPIDNNTKSNSGIFEQVIADFLNDR